MPDENRPGSSLEAAAGMAGPYATEAFDLLSDETRLAVLLALWEAHDPGSGDDSLSFSELFERVDYDNAGNFSYHLERLEGQFLRKRAEGRYELRDTGLELVKTVIGGAGVEDTHVDRTEVARDCPICEAVTAVFYRDGALYQVCTECEGITTEHDLPEGYLNAMKLHPAATTDRSPEELFAAAGVAAHRHIRTMFEGLCSACSGPVDAELDVCTEHETGDGACPNCGRNHAYWTEFQCRVCKDFHATTPTVVALFHPAVVAFYEDHGVSTRWHADDFESVTRIMDLYTAHGMDLVAETPPRVEVTVECESDDLALTFDETVSVVDVRR